MISEAAVGRGKSWVKSLESRVYEVLLGIVQVGHQVKTDRLSWTSHSLVEVIG